METNEKPTLFGNFSDRFSTTIKLVVVAFLTLLLLIPLSMVNSLIRERQQTKSSAIDDITVKWGTQQTITGPFLVVPYNETVIEDGKQVITKKTLLVLPETLLADGKIDVEKRSRGIYDASVYKSEVNLSGTFIINAIKNSGVKEEQLLLNESRVILSLSDLRGIREGVTLDFAGQSYAFEPGLPIENLVVSNQYNSGVRSSDGVKYVMRDGVQEESQGPIFAEGLNAKLDSLGLKNAQEEIPFSIRLNLNGSHGFYLVPVGKTSSASIRANWGTPSFTGEYLPENHEVTDNGFTAQWKVLHLNRGYGQYITPNNQKDIDLMSTSRFGVQFIQAVDQYQQNMRSVKYAILIILLTFVAVFFIELSRKHAAVNPFQYLLIGLALILFYTLLLSMSEVWGFTIAYVVAAIMTVALITVHMGSVLRSRKMALIIGGVLTFLYLFIFILIQMETYALLFGSLMLFAILAVIMYYSKRLKF